MNTHNPPGSFDGTFVSGKINMGGDDAEVVTVNRLRGERQHQREANCAKTP